MRGCFCVPTVVSWESPTLETSHLWGGVMNLASNKTRRVLFAGGFILSRDAEGRFLGSSAVLCCSAGRPPTGLVLTLRFAWQPHRIVSHLWTQIAIMAPQPHDGCLD